jgi:uncharacterized alpha-E superfamily protein
MLDVKYFILLPEPNYVGSPFDNIQWAAVLKSASALEMYRMRYHRIDPMDVAEFLILDRDFPRSIRFCVATAEWALHQITGSPLDSYNNDAERLMGRLSSDLGFAKIDEIRAIGMHEYLDGVQLRLNDIGDTIYESFFAMRAPDQQQSQQQSQRQY